MNRFVAAVLAPSLLATGCASHFDRSLQRWNRYVSGNGPYSHWAWCIWKRSDYYLSPGPAPSEDAQPEPAPDSHRVQLFTHVLADCRGSMSKEAWALLPDGRVRQLIGDAWQAFTNVESEIRMREMEAII
jgi:hypothetical protein